MSCSDYAASHKSSENIALKCGLRTTQEYHREGRPSSGKKKGMRRSALDVLEFLGKGHRRVLVFKVLLVGLGVGHQAPANAALEGEFLGSKSLLFLQGRALGFAILSISLQALGLLLSFLVSTSHLTQGYLVDFGRS